MCVVQVVHSRKFYISDHFMLINYLWGCEPISFAIGATRTVLGAEGEEREMKIKRKRTTERETERQRERDRLDFYFFLFILW